ncbi:cytochrome c [Loktanella sp. SALINAS62]|uniref:c-type cytochrome n=1 Tax=Loktanella sp. SALINAS62 TaxID=2706124 RepID=UPI001B8BAA84|nr:cytochrome c [Loktanella sp. SALINAS62]MBS1303321.1 c-type cytochrome [Loktanella sp. SALINAS62]
MRRWVRNLLYAALTAFVTGVAAFLLGGFHELSAIRQHPALVYWGLNFVRNSVVGIAAEGVKEPPGFTIGTTPLGVALYDRHCTKCHGAPGVAPDTFALGMMPVPPNLAGVARDSPSNEIYWFIRNGLKMSGMPAWHLRLSEAEMWDITATVKAIPNLSPRDWQALLQNKIEPTPADPQLPTGYQPDETRGKLALQLYGCRSCHMIPGLIGRPDVHVGPPLNEAGSRRYVAGVLAHDKGALARWIAHPQTVDPLSAMPDLGVPEIIAHDMAAYLYSIATHPRIGCAERPIDESEFLEQPASVPDCVVPPSDAP